MINNRAQPPGRLATQGFSLIELMVALVIVAILAVIAGPNFSDAIKRNRVESLAREVASALNLARSEAASRGRTVILCRSVTGSSCSGTTNATEGWLIFEDTDNSGDLDAGGSEPILRVHDELTNTRLRVYTGPSGAGNTSTVSFDRHGFSNAQVTFEVCEDTLNTTFARALVMENSGRIARSRVNGGSGLHRDVTGNDLTCP